ncbi:MAG: hypothetical protein LUC85_12005 [Bacteroidales bacterium]|nr:hypothetical protein [Bacteroidales bacterium]
MKRFFTLALMAAAIATSNATVLWTGTCTFADWTTTDERPTFQASVFENSQVGDKLILTLTNNAADPQSWHQCELYDPDITTSYANSGQITSATTSVTFTFDDTLLANLQSTGCTLAGTGYIVTQIELSEYDGVIWEGECVCQNWTATPAVRILGSDFSTAQVGQNLVFYCSMINTEAWSCIQIDNANWKTSSFGQTELSPETTQVSFNLTAELRAELISNGINITGDNFILTKIALEGDGSGKGDDEETIVWAGTTDMGSWNYITIEASKFATIAAGQYLYITYEDASNEAQICLKQNLSTGWEELPADTEWGNYISVADGSGFVAFAVNADAATTLKENGLVLTGHDYTLKKVTLSGTFGIVDSITVAPVVKDSAVYNLLGVRVADSMDAPLAPGIYISGGKKYLVK